MNRRELVLALAEKTGLERKQADAAVAALVEVITDTVAAGDVVSIPGFAKFARRDYPARMGRNPATGESIRIPASKKVRITPLKAFKDAAMAGKRSAAKKAAPAKKAAAKKAPAKKAAAAKKAPAKR